MNHPQLRHTAKQVVVQLSSNEYRFRPGRHLGFRDRIPVNAKFLVTRLCPFSGGALSCERVIPHADIVREQRQPLSHQLGRKQSLGALPEASRRLGNVSQLEGHLAAHLMSAVLLGFGGGGGGLLCALTLKGHLSRKLSTCRGAELALPRDPVADVSLPALFVLLLT
eukprot:scaffold18405_cov26-Tisochrysis_lutea.AAC.3